MTKAEKNQQETLYKGGQFHVDPWTYLSDEEALPAAGPVFVTFARAIDLLKDGKSISQLGVVIEPSDSVEEIVESLPHITAIAISFPAFADGRGFSTARLLRERYNFEGELRAIGAYILDQMPFLVRCGVDSFEVSDDAVRAGLERGDWPEVTNYYQPTGHDNQAPIASRPWLRRRNG